MAYYFYLRSSVGDAPIPIMMRFRDDGGQFKISTKVTVIPSDWDAETQSVASTDRLYKYKNSRLTEFRLEAERTSLRLAEGRPFEEARDTFFRIFGREARKKKEEDNSLLLYYHEWATTKKEGHTPTPQTLHSWHLLREYRCPLSFSDVDIKFYQGFCKWMDEVKKYKTNTKGYQIKNLKAVMNAAYKEGLHNNAAFHNFKLPHEEVDSIYLTEDELDALYYLQTDGMKAKARDIFLVGCYTAMRWSDYSRLSDKDIVDDTIYFTHKKTGYRVSIPLHPIVREILDRYDGAVPEISDQKLNKYIKEVCKDAGITQPATRVYYKGGERVEEVRPKCELVSSHTARRTAATNMYKSGVPAYNIMLITGHTSEATFRKYIKFEKERNAELMRDNPYFKKRGSGSTPSGR